MSTENQQTVKPLSPSEKMRKQIDQSEKAGDKKFVPASDEDTKEFDEENDNKE